MRVCLTWTRVASLRSLVVFVSTSADDCHSRPLGRVISSPMIFVCRQVCLPRQLVQKPKDYLCDIRILVCEFQRFWDIQLKLSFLKHCWVHSHQKDTFLLMSASSKTPCSTRCFLATAHLWSTAANTRVSFPPAILRGQVLTLWIGFKKEWVWFCGSCTSSLSWNKMVADYQTRCRFYVQHCSFCFFRFQNRHPSDDQQCFR